MGRRELIRTLNAEISQLKGEISKREDIIFKLQQLEDLSGIGIKTRRGPGRPPGSVSQRGRKSKRGPGRPPLMGKKTPLRRKYDVPVGDMIAGVLKGMKQPASLDDLTVKVHKRYPTLGGVKYRAIVSSIVSRDPKFKRIGKDKIALK